MDKSKIVLIPEDNDQYNSLFGRPKYHEKVEHKSRIIFHYDPIAYAMSIRPIIDKFIGADIYFPGITEDDLNMLRGREYGSFRTVINSDKGEYHFYDVVPDLLDHEAAEEVKSYFLTKFGTRVLINEKLSKYEKVLHSILEAQDDDGMYFFDIEGSPSKLFRILITLSEVYKRNQQLDAVYSNVKVEAPLYQTVTDADITLELLDVVRLPRKYGKNHQYWFTCVDNLYTYCLPVNNTLSKDLLDYILKTNNNKINVTVKKAKGVKVVGMSKSVWEIDDFVLR